MVNPKRKGNTGERKFLEVMLETAGREKVWKDKRNSQATNFGGLGNPDVSFYQMSGVFWEVKNTKSFEIKAWWPTLVGDCPMGKIPALAYKEQGVGFHSGFWVALPFDKLESFSIEILEWAGKTVSPVLDSSSLDVHLYRMGSGNFMFNNKKNEVKNSDELSMLTYELESYGLVAIFRQPDLLQICTKVAESRGWEVL